MRECRHCGQSLYDGWIGTTANESADTCARCECRLHDSEERRQMPRLDRILSGQESGTVTLDSSWRRCGDGMFRDELTGAELEWCDDFSAYITVPGGGRELFREMLVDVRLRGEECGSED